MSKYDTSKPSEALARAGFQNNVIVHIKAVAPGFRFAGSAVTIKQAAGAYGMFTSDDFKVGEMVDGGVRDLKEMIEFDFPVFSRHMLSATGRMRLKVESINTPVTIDGVSVSPGDIIVADGTGAVIVPLKHAEEITGMAEKFARDDDAAIEDLRAGLTFTQAMKKYKAI